MLKTIYILLFIYNIGVFGQQKWVLDLCKNRESHWVSQTKCQIEGFLKIETLCFELSHSIESSLRSLSTM